MDFPKSYHPNQSSSKPVVVVAGENDDKLVGMLDYRKAMRQISAEVLRRRQQADQIALEGS